MAEMPPAQASAGATKPGRYMLPLRWQLRLLSGNLQQVSTKYFDVKPIRHAQLLLISAVSQIIPIALGKGFQELINNRGVA